MSISIPDGFWDKYNEVCDLFLSDNNFSRVCTIVYPPKKIKCDNCTLKPVGASSTNVYRNGGPAPFNFGSCPLCGGNGYKEQSITDDIRLRLYWNRRDWLKLAGKLVIPENTDLMIIGNMSDAVKIKNSVEIIVAKDNQEGV